MTYLLVAFLLATVVPLLVAAWRTSLVAVFVFMQVEAARVPVDDPTTHLELTMIHEVMVLDHSGPDLAAIQYASAMKLTICAAFVAALVNPLHGSGLLGAAANVVLTLLVAVAVGCVESLVARLRLRAVPQYVLSATVAALVNPLHGSGLLGAAANVFLTLLVAVAVGCVESLVARLRLRAVPQYVLSATVAALIALLTTSWWQGGVR